MSHIKLLEICGSLQNDALHRGPDGRIRLSDRGRFSGRPDI